MTDLTQRSANEFKFGLLAGRRIVSTLPDSISWRNDWQNFVSRSCRRYRQPLRNPHPRMVAFRACCSIHSSSGCGLFSALHVCMSFVFGGLAQLPGEEVGIQKSEACNCYGLHLFCAVSPSANAFFLQQVRPLACLIRAAKCVDVFSPFVFTAVMQVAVPCVWFACAARPIRIFWGGRETPWRTVRQRVGSLPPFPRFCSRPDFHF